MAKKKKLINSKLIIALLIMYAAWITYLYTRNYSTIPGSVISNQTPTPTESTTIRDLYSFDYQKNNIYLGNSQVVVPKGWFVALCPLDKPGINYQNRVYISENRQTTCDKIDTSNSILFSAIINESKREPQPHECNGIGISNVQKTYQIKIGDSQAFEYLLTSVDGPGNYYVQTCFNSKDLTYFFSSPLELKDVYDQLVKSFSYSSWQ